MMMTHDNMIIVNAVNVAMMLLIMIDPATSALRWRRGRGSESRECAYLVFVTDTTDGVCAKKIARCKLLQI